MTADATWIEIVDAHGETILNVAYRLLRNMHDAEDVAQQVLLEAVAMESLPEIGLLKRMAAFRSIDRLRQRNDAICFDETSHAPLTGDAVQAFEAQEQADLLRTAIARLPERQAQCFWLRHVEGLSNREIARCQSISESAVSTALNKARRALRNAVSKEHKSSHE